MTEVEVVDAINVGTAWKPEIVDHTQQSTAIIEANPYTLLQMAIERNLDTERISQFMDLQDRMEKKEALRLYTAAMIRVQKRSPIVVKDKKNDSTDSWYARLEKVAKEIKPIYLEEGFSLEFGEADSPLEHHRRIVCDVTHEGGCQKQFHLDSKIDDVGAKGGANKTAVQGLGSMVSYLRRYLTLMIFNIIVADEDNDGGNQSGTLTSEQCAYLRTKLKECEDLKAPIREASFIAWIAEEQRNRENVKVLEDIQVRFYEKAKKAIDNKYQAAIAKGVGPK